MIRSEVFDERRNAAIRDRGQNDIFWAVCWDCCSSEKERRKRDEALPISEFLPLPVSVIYTAACANI